MTVGETIKTLRKKQGFTQKELAEKCNCATGTIQQYELGKRQPRLEQLKHIAKVLNVYVGELLGDDYENYKGQLVSDYSATIAHALKNATVEVHTYYGDAEKSERMENLFEELNDVGQEKAIEQVELLTKIPEYQKKDSAE